MSGSRKRLPKDPNLLAHEIVRLSTEQESEKLQTATDTESKKSAISAYLAEIGRKGGLKGGKARAKKLSAKARKVIAKKAAQIRWKNK